MMDNSTLGPLQPDEYPGMQWWRGFISELIKTLKLFDGDEEHVRVPRPGR